MGNFLNWFNNKLSVERFPLPGELNSNLMNGKIKHVINVSDEYIHANNQICIINNVFHHWFPLTETTLNMGLNNIYSSLQILWIAEHNNDGVLLHCHAGCNRSVTIAEMYYYMRTKTQLVRKNNPKLDKQILSMFVFNSEQDKIESEKIMKNNRFEINILSGHLPAKHLLEHFLKECELAFKGYEIGEISLDGIKHKTLTLSY